MPTASDPPTEFLTRDDVARLLKISRATVYRLVETRRLPFYKIGNSLRFDKQDVLAFLRQHRVEALGTHTYGS
jgi:excisionase family DNA binding protein